VAYLQPMTTIACPSCAVAYGVDVARFPASEVRVGCLRCGAELFLRLHSRADGRAGAAPAPPDILAPSAPPEWARDRTSSPSRIGDAQPETTPAAGLGSAWGPPRDDAAATAESGSERGVAEAGRGSEPAVPETAGWAGPAAAAASAATAGAPPAAPPREAPPSFPPAPHEHAVAEPVSGAAGRGAELDEGFTPPAEAGDDLGPSRRPASSAGGEGFTFAQVGDVASRARRLARALVSDIVVYHPRKVEQGRREGSLREVLREEVDKSWEEYCERLGPDVARTHRPAFVAALNAILAHGQPVF
jgi:hypothetical protein